MESLFITFRNNKIHYRRWGKGHRILVCFHGFAEDAGSFSVLDEVCGEDCLVLAFDMPYHGETIWNEGIRFTPADLRDLLRLCPDIGDGSFGVAGYSMGGRVALSLFELIPDKIEEIILLAPDGLVVNPWYKLATQTFLGNRLFRYTMQNPGWFVHMLKTGKKLNLVNTSISKFVHHQVENLTMREKIYAVWTTMRKFRPDLLQIRKKIKDHKTPVCLIFGKYDKIIRSGSGRDFIKGIEPFALLTELNTGHQLLLADQIPSLKEVFHYFFKNFRHPNV